MLPVYLALIAYLVSAAVFLVDKYLLASPLPRPLAYAFWIAVLSSFVVILIPFGVSLQTPLYLSVIFISGMSTFIGLVFLYESIMAGDISVASAKVGAFSAISSYLLSPIILNGQERSLSLGALILLVAGILFLARTGGKTVLAYSIISGIFIGLSLVLLKWAFNNSDFINGIFWTRIAFVFSAFIVLLSPEARSQIGKFVTRSPLNSKWLFVSNKILATVGFLILYYSIRLGAVETINALLGFQFVFVFVLALIFQPYFPKLEQNLDRRALTNKIIGIGLILSGFILVIAT